MSDSQPDQQLVRVDSVDALQELVRNSESILVVGNRTKPSLSSVARPTTLVTTQSLAGIIQYEPSEFTFTALAGTTLREINAALAKKKQYLPFDPMLAGSEATIGGTLAAGMSGPGRHRYGGVRDFILGAQFVAGDGQLITSGGKVVKNAAGFDIPKLLVGSCGRLAAITALTFKVFPRPSDFHTYQIRCDDHEEAIGVIALLARGRWELDAIDYRPTTQSIWFRMGGTKPVCDSIAIDVAESMGRGDVLPMPRELAADAWTQLIDLRFGGPARANIVKIPMNLQQMQRLANWCDDHVDKVYLHASAAGSIGWLAVSDGMIDETDLFLKESEMNGLVLRGSSDQASHWMIGAYRCGPIETAVKKAMDPPGRFPSLSG